LGDGGTELHEETITGIGRRDGGGHDA
jgi:hypothetical protein